MFETENKLIEIDDDAMSIFLLEYSDSVLKLLILRICEFFKSYYFITFSYLFIEYYLLCLLLGENYTERRFQDALRSLIEMGILFDEKNFIGDREFTTMYNPEELQEYILELEREKKQILEKVRKLLGED
ncbi:hypothetical protein LCGC14_2152060 [marine sediment metagenome]|uniref:Uncharacterized protein n=1 Tax=marine sediment metagenome TaxID=412755 RepID=A0A0F9GRK6_9ZZZZ